MYRLISISIVIIILFTGCVKTNAEYNILRNNKQNSIKTFSTLTEKILENEKALTIELGDTSKDVVILEKQRVFASKLSISKMNEPFSLDITSSSMAGFFAPKIFFLNENNNVVRTTTAKDLQFDRGFFKGTIFINNDYRKIHSLIVTQDLKELNSKYKINYVNSVPIIVPVGPYMMTYVSSAGDQNKTVKNAYGGNVKLMLKVYNPTTVGAK